MNDEKQTRRKLILSTFWIVLGITLVVLTGTGTIPDAAWSGMGGGFIGVGIMQLIQKIRYMKDPSYREQVDVEVSDERNSFIRMKAWSWTGYIFVLGSAVLAAVFLVMGRDDISHVLGFCVCAELIIYCIVYYTLRKKY